VGKTVTTKKKKEQSNASQVLRAQKMSLDGVAASHVQQATMQLRWGHERKTQVIRVSGGLSRPGLEGNLHLQYKEKFDGTIQQRGGIRAIDPKNRSRADH